MELGLLAQRADVTGTLYRQRDRIRTKFKINVGDVGISRPTADSGPGRAVARIRQHQTIRSEKVAKLFGGSLGKEIHPGPTGTAQFCQISRRLQIPMLPRGIDRDIIDPEVSKRARERTLRLRRGSKRHATPVQADQITQMPRLDKHLETAGGRGVPPAWAHQTERARSCQTKQCRCCCDVNVFQAEVTIRPTA